MKEFEFFHAAEEGMKINESADRKNLRALDRDQDEDELLINANDPKNRFINADDIRDDFNEDPDTEPEPETPEEPGENIIMTAEHPEIKYANKETGKMGAAHADGQSVIINREKGEQVFEMDKEALQDKYEPLAEELERSFQPLKDNRYADDWESHAGDNLKTMPENKKERSLRGKTRKLLKSA